LSKKWIHPTRDHNIGINKQTSKQAKSNYKMAPSNVVAMLDDLAGELESMQNSLSKLKVSEKKPRKVTEKGVLQAAKTLYYHDNKKSEHVMSILREKYGNDFKITLLNFRKAQKVTDEMFDGDSAKDDYIQRARVQKGCA
jgi:hypothetical protein